MVAQENKAFVLAKSGAVPAAINVITLSEESKSLLLNPKVDIKEYSPIGDGKRGNTKTYMDDQRIKVDFELNTHIRKATSLGTAPGISELLKMCGLAETLTVTTKADYAPGGVFIGSGQVEVFNDGFSRLVTGVVGNAKISGKIGEPLKAKFSLSGYTTPSATLKANPVVTLDTNAMIMISKITAVLVGGAQVVLKEFELDFGNEIKETYGTSVLESYIADYKPKLSATIVKTKTTDEAAWVDLATPNIKAILITAGLGGSQFILSVPFVDTVALDEGEADGRITMKRDFLARNSVGNDNFKLTWQ